MAKRDMSNFNPDSGSETLYIKPPGKRFIKVPALGDIWYGFGEYFESYHKVCEYMNICELNSPSYIRIQQTPRYRISFVVKTPLSKSIFQMFGLWWTGFSNTIPVQMKTASGGLFGNAYLEYISEPPIEFDRKKYKNDLDKEIEPYIEVILFFENVSVQVNE